MEKIDKGVIVDLKIPVAYLHEWVEKGIEADIPPRYLLMIYHKFYRWLIAKIIYITDIDLTRSINSWQKFYQMKQAYQYIMSSDFVDHCRDLQIDWKKLRADYSKKYLTKLIKFNHEQKERDKYGNKSL